MELDIINPNCAGIDIGSKSHYIAVGQALEDVKEFGVYADDLTDICLHSQDFSFAGFDSITLGWTVVSLIAMYRFKIGMITWIGTSAIFGLVYYLTTH